MTRLINKFLKDRTGATAVEYALIVALMAAVIVTAITTLGDGLKTAFSDIGTKLTSTTGTLAGGADGG
jgi:pilus assembly protein Flp/PilA